MAQDWVSVQRNTIAAIALGGNSPSARGRPEHTIVSAVEEIGRRVGPILALSRFYRTPAFPAGSGADFVNAAALVAAGADAEAVLAALHAIEAGHGRERAARWGARTLDLDLLMLGDEIRPDRDRQAAWMALPPGRQATEAPGELILPHPRLHERAFVLIPLAEIAPNLRHPVTGATVAGMLRALPEAEKASICPL